VNDEQTPSEAPVAEATDATETAAPANQEAAADVRSAVTSEAPDARSRRKVRVGVVVSDAMDKTVLVRIDRRVRHPLYKKTLARSNKLAAHDEGNEAHVGDTVRVMETRPLSKTKRWRIVEIVERAR
jgi:small subunit ribosomal protein S17